MGETNPYEARVWEALGTEDRKTTESFKKEFAVALAIGAVLLLRPYVVVRLIDLLGL